MVIQENEHEFKGKTLQEYLDWKYPEKEDKEGAEEIYISNKKLWGELWGELDMREFVNLTKFYCPHNNLTSLNVSGCVNLTDLYIDAKLFHPENKIIGLEKTSIIRLDCHGGDLLLKSQDPKFIWDVFVRKYNTTFPEMKLIDINDLSKLAGQVNETTVNDEEFLKKMGVSYFVKNEKGDYYWILDQLANSILARCLIVINRLYTEKKDPEYEKHLIELSQQDLKCVSMNPKYPEASLYENREKLVNQALIPDLNLLKRLADLPYISKWVKEQLETAKSTISQQTQTEFSTQEKSTQTDLTMEQIKQWEQGDNKKTLYQNFVDKYGKK